MMKRREFTTRSSDPTTVVEWLDKEADVKVIEFQNVYVVEKGTMAPVNMEQYLGEQLHQALETAQRMKETIDELRARLANDDEREDVDG